MLKLKLITIKAKGRRIKNFEKEHEGLNEKIDKEADAEVEKELTSIKSTFEKKRVQLLNC